ncbi:MAG: Nif3-like dinuclear metal center hexameric protein [Thermoguttaceae bacterium]|nr:Nif3-like dinuclear metal center hexameric protein [Thermoguttaceae bacterium]
MTIDRAVVDEAVATGVDCVVSHHPFPFRAAKRWTFDTTDGEILSKLMGAKIAVYSPHTAHDSAFFGINRQLAAGLGLLDVRPLIPGTVAASRDALDGLESSVADEVAQDFPTKGAKSDGAAPLLGTGRIGRCEKPTTFAALIEQVKDMLQIPALLAVGDDKKTIRKVAIGCGAADDFVGYAADAGADALLLGEARFHACLEARARGIGLILAGHYATERFAACILADRIARKFPELSVKASDKESDPIRVV